MRKILFISVLIVLSSSLMSLNGICAFGGDAVLASENLQAVFEKGTLVDLTTLNGYDILKSFDIVVNRKRFIPESWRTERNEILVFGKAGKSEIKVVYEIKSFRVDVRVSSPSDIFEVRFLVEHCDPSPLVMRGLDIHFIQGRHVAYAFELKGSRSAFIAGRLVIFKRNPGNDIELKIYVAKDVQTIEESLGISNTPKEMSVVDENGSPLPGLVVVLKRDGKIMSASEANENGRVRFDYRDGDEISLLWGEDYEVKGVKDGKIVVDTHGKRGWRWQPYLAGMDEKSVWVAMRSWRPFKVVVTSGGKSYTDGIFDTFHMIKVPISNSITVKAPFSSSVLHPIPPEGDFSFAIYGDTRTNEDWHEIVCNAIAKENISFVIHTGDLVESGDLMRDWDKFFRASSNLYSKAAIMPTLGNHEHNSPIYYQAFALRKGEGDFQKRWYSYSFGGILFVVLDSNVSEGSSAYRIQTEWLKEQLENAKKYRMVIVYYHHPFFTNSPNREPSLKEEWKELFEKYKVAVVFNGHIHHYERFEMNGVTYVTTGGGGAPLGFGLMSSRRKYLPGTKAGAAGYLHYVLAKVEENGVRFIVKAVRKYDWGKLEEPDRNVLDEFFIPWRK